MKDKIIDSLRVISLSLILSATVGYSLAEFVGPSEIPPAGNPAPPINVGTATQVKDGNLFLAAGSTFGATTGNFSNVSVTGKITSSSTASGDPGTTVATKDYVDSKTNSCSPKWTPDPSGFCSSQSYSQTDGCGHSRTVSGTKDCSTCTDTTWSPSPSSTCSYQTLTQTSNCGTTRTVSGTKDNCPLQLTSCVDNTCSGVWGEVFPVRNGFGMQNTYGSICYGNWTIDVSGGNWNSTCDTGWLAAGNCNYPGGSTTISNCPSVTPARTTVDVPNMDCNSTETKGFNGSDYGPNYCRGWNSVVHPTNSAHPTNGTALCTGMYLIKTNGENWLSACSTGWQ